MSALLSPALTSVVDASYSAGFASWACVTQGAQHVRSGAALSSTHAELLAAKLAVITAPPGCTHLDIRTDCEGAAFHARHATPLAASLLRAARKRGVRLTLTHAAREEVRAAHDLAYRTFRHKRRPDLGRTVTGTFTLPPEGGLQVTFPAEGVDVHEALTGPLGQVGLQVIARAAARLPDGVHADLTGVPARLQDLWAKPAAPWHPCPAFIAAQHLTLLDSGVTLRFT